MSAKYSGLPDIDSAPDVFETPDEPETHQISEEEPERPIATSSDIDRSRLPSRKTELTSDGNDAPPKENHLARLRRLRAEVRELEAELGGETPTQSQRPSVIPRQPLDVVSELSTLRDRLSIASETVNVQSQETSPPRLDFTSPPKPSPSIDSDLDKRLANLERLVGTGSEEQNLSDTVARLDNLVSILTQPRHLDSISRRVKLLVADLDRASAASRKGAQPPSEGSTITLQSAEYEQLQSLFAVLPRLDPLLPIIPPLLTRLRSLSTLHAEALEIAHDLREMQSSNAAMEDQETELKAVVEGVRKGLADAAGLIEGNWSSLQVRLKELDERVKKLNA